MGNILVIQVKYAPDVYTLGAIQRVDKANFTIADYGRIDAIWEKFHQTQCPDDSDESVVCLLWETGVYEEADLPDHILLEG